MMSESSTLDVRVRKRYPGFELDVAFTASRGITVLFGRSGSGKSLTLRLIAGLERPDTGRIVIAGTPVVDTERRLWVPPYRRPIGVVFQQPGLLPHLSVGDNILFGLRLPRDEARRRLEEVLTLLGLSGMERRSPRTLSGGEQQRVALARALVRRPPLLLLDEPFSALDQNLRRSLREELRRITGDLGLAVVFVTHSLPEAHLLADSLVVVERGRILQMGEAAETFRRPSTPHVARLLGWVNLWPAVAVHRDGPETVVDLGGRRLLVRGGAQPTPPGGRVVVGIRSERVIVHRGEASPAPNQFEARLTELLRYGSTATLRLRPPEGDLLLEVELGARALEVLRVGERDSWIVELPPEDLHLMPAET